MRNLVLDADQKKISSLTTIATVFADHLDDEQIIFILHKGFILKVY